MRQFFKKAESFTEILLGLMAFSGIALMTIGVVTRYILKVSINWSDEYLRTMFIWTYFIGAAMLYSSGGLMRLELLDDFLEKHCFHKVKTVVAIVMEILLGGYCGFMAYYVYSLTCKYIEKGTTSSTSNVPAWVLILGMGIGFVMIICFAIRNIVLHLKKMKNA